jgi:hypothetical protein
MAHWAELDKDNKVIRVTVGNNNDPDEGYRWLIDNLGGRWVQTSYNANFRGKFASIGDTYDESLDQFIEIQTTTTEENYEITLQETDSSY